MYVGKLKGKRNPCIRFNLFDGGAVLPGMPWVLEFLRIYLLISDLMCLGAFTQITPSVWTPTGKWVQVTLRASEGDSEGQMVRT